MFESLLRTCQSSNKEHILFFSEECNIIKARKRLDQTWRTMLQIRNQIDLFTQQITQNASLPELQNKFEESFPGNNTLTEEEVKDVVDSASENLATEKTIKLFSRAISPGLCKQVYKYIKNQEEIEDIPEELRAYVTLRHCEEKHKCATEVISKMNNVDIADQRLRYKFAVYAAKQRVSDFTNEFTDFEITDDIYVRRLAEVALYYDADAFLSDLNEFDFLENPTREKYFLQALARSIGAITKLLSDDYFISSLQDMPTEVLKMLYTKFGFGKKIIEIASGEAQLSSNSTFSKIISDLKNNRDIYNNDEASVFALFVKNADSPHLKGKWGVSDVISDVFFDGLDDDHQIPLLAMIFLLKAIENPLEIIRHEEVQRFLTEINSLKDPGARFAVVAIVLKGVDDGKPLLDQLRHVNGQGIRAVVYNTCVRLCKSQDYNNIKKKWNDDIFLKKFVLFLSELLFSEKLNNRNRGTILSKIFNDTTSEIEELLIDYSSCLTLRLIKPLIDGISPRNILADRGIRLINRLGAPFKCKIDQNLYSKLRHTEDIIRYVQSLSKLSENDKEDLVPFFFEFLTALGNGSMPSMRFTKEVQKLFETYNLSRDTWEKETCEKVSAILKRQPQAQLEAAETFTKTALLEVFEHHHLDSNEFSPLYNFLLNPTTSPPEVNGREIEKLKKGSQEDKNKVIMHLLSRLSNPSETNQLNLLKQLRPFFPDNHDFRKDLEGWIKALQNPKQNLQYQDYEIVRSSDPYTLFRIGSLAGESCQRVNGDPEKNKCLLAYPCDGKNSVIYARDNNKEIQARAILRFFYAYDPKDKISAILEDSSISNQEPYIKKFPVLYLEPIYPKGTCDILRTAIKQYAIECAKELKVPLLRHKLKEPLQVYPYTLGTINGPAPYEYFDGIQRKIKENNKINGDWQRFFVAPIPGSEVELLYDPEKS